VQEDQALSDSKPTSKVGSTQNLAKILFSETNFDEDPRFVIERWPALPAEFRRAIFKLAA
jgi:hypothetical protein